MPRKKILKATKPVDYSNLCASDVLCPICRTILTEPVTLPCNHGFCYLCFNDTMENTNLVCPLCRVRVGSWLRTAKKENRVINEMLWSAIKKQYPKEIQNKYDGIQSAIEDLKPVIVVANPGEIRTEYELEKCKLTVELEKIKIDEEKASAALIKQLQAEDQLNQSIQEEKLKQDAQLAKQLASQLSPSTSKSLNKSRHGPLDKFLLKKESSVISPSVNIASKEYTCRVLCLDNHLDKASTSASYSRTGSSKLLSSRSKLEQTQQLKKLKNVWGSKQQLWQKHGGNSRIGSSNSRASGGSEIDWARYSFKPIETHKCVQVKVVPIRVVCKRVAVGDDLKIIPPCGITPNLFSNHTAFAKYSTSNLKQESTITSTEVKEEKSPHTSKRNAKTKNALINNLLEKNNTHTTKNSDTIRISKRRLQNNNNNNNLIQLKQDNNTSVKLNNNTKVVKRKVESSTSDSPEVFYGFDPNDLTNTAVLDELLLLEHQLKHVKQIETKQTPINNNNDNKVCKRQKIDNANHQKIISINNVNKIIVEDRVGGGSPSPILVRKNNARVTRRQEEQLNNRLLQEQYDYEYAKKLQAELNSSMSPFCVSNRTRSRKQRQVTLDEMLAV